MGGASRLTCAREGWAGRVEERAARFEGAPVTSASRHHLLLVLDCLELRIDRRSIRSSSCACGRAHGDTRGEGVARARALGARWRCGRRAGGTRTWTWIVRHFRCSSQSRAAPANDARSTRVRWAGDGQQDGRADAATAAAHGGRGGRGAALSVEAASSRAALTIVSFGVVAGSTRETTRETTRKAKLDDVGAFRFFFGRGVRKRGQCLLRRG